MKRTNLYTFFLLLVTPIAAFTQDCSRSPYLQRNATIEITAYNQKGSVSGRRVCTVLDVRADSGTTTADIRIQQFSKRNKPGGVLTGRMKCSGTFFWMDMKLLLPQLPSSNAQKAKFSGEGFLPYPSEMKAGDTLTGGTLVMSTGKGTAITVAVFNRRVAGHDSVTTTAGTWDCERISYKKKLSFKMNPLPEMSTTEDDTDWFAPGVGVVKTETEDGATAITSIK